MTFAEKAGKTLLVMHELYPSKEALDAAGTGGGGMMKGNVRATGRAVRHRRECGYHHEACDTIGSVAGQPASAATLQQVANLRMQILMAVWWGLLQRIGWVWRALPGLGISSTESGHAILQIATCCPRSHFAPTCSSSRDLLTDARFLAGVDIVSVCRGTVLHHQQHGFFQTVHSSESFSEKWIRESPSTASRVQAPERSETSTVRHVLLNQQSSHTSTAAFAWVFKGCRLRLRSIKLQFPSSFRCIVEFVLLRDRSLNLVLDQHRCGNQSR